jgi:hypothetical protein
MTKMSSELNIRANFWFEVLEYNLEVILKKQINSILGQWYRAKSFLNEADKLFDQIKERTRLVSHTMM